MNTSRETHATMGGNDWREVCGERDLVAESGVVVLLEGRQIALFYLPQQTDRPLYALDNRDPKSSANVIGRGIVGQLGGELVIASPLYKQHFRLEDGSCVEYPEQRLRAWPVRLRDGKVEVFDGE